MLTFNFSVGRCLFLRVLAGVVACVEAFAICGYAFPGFPHFTFVLVWKQIVNLYYSDCRALMCWHRQSYWNGARITPRLETECLSIFDFICRDTLYRDLSRSNDQELLTAFDNKSYCLCSVIATRCFSVKQVHYHKWLQNDGITSLVDLFSIAKQSIEQVQPEMLEIPWQLRSHRSAF